MGCEVMNMDKIYNDTHIAKFLIKQLDTMTRLYKYSPVADMYEHFCDMRKTTKTKSPLQSAFENYPNNSTVICIYSPLLGVRSIYEYRGVNDI